MPRNRSFREKKRTVRDIPMVNVNPVRNNTSPSASSVESNKNNEPRKRKVNPRNISPVPIFVLSDTIFVNFSGVGEYTGYIKRKSRKWVLRLCKRSCPNDIANNGAVMGTEFRRTV